MKRTCLFLLFPFALHAQKTVPQSLDAYMQNQAALYGFSGNALVAKNGQVIYRRSFGYSDYATGAKLDSNSVFDIGSIAKEFTAVGILLLKDAGKLKVTDSLRKFFPELPYHNITIRQMLTHSSGMPEGFALVKAFFDHNKIAGNNDLVRLLAEKKPPALFEPGTNVIYSGTAFNLLAAIIEKISGQAFAKYMQEKVFTPLGMTHTQVANHPRSPAAIPGYAYGYGYVDSLHGYQRGDSMQPEWYTYLSGITGEGMLITTTADLFSWDQSLKNHSLLSPATQAEMFSLQAERTTVPIVQWGYGTRVGENELGKYVFHNGFMPGYVSMHIRYIKEDITVIVLSNNESHAEFIADALAAITMNKNFVMSSAHTEANKNTLHTALDLFAGKYKMLLTRPPYMAAFPVTLIVKENQLVIQLPGGAEKILKRETETSFFFADGTDQQISFETDGSGRPIKAWHIAWGVKREMPKME